MSATMTSGRNLPAASMSWRPSSTTPTRSNSGLSRLVSASATMRWSSARRTRGRCAALIRILLLYGHPGDDPGALAGGALDVERAAHQAHAFAHAGEAEVHPLSGMPGLEPDAVVGDGEEQPVADLAKRDVRAACSRVAGHIAQRLLSDPEQAERGVLGERARQRAEVRGDVELAPARPPSALRAQRLGESQLLQDRGVQLVGQRVDVLAQAHQPFADGLHGLGLLSVRSGEFGAADLDRQHGEPLAHVVVQLAREQGALLFLGADEAAAQFARLLLGPLAARSHRGGPRSVRTARPPASRAAAPARCWIQRSSPSGCR